jgi:hypothetical protein
MPKKKTVGPEPATELRCAFCAKGRSEVGPAVEAASGASICRQCAKICLDIFDDFLARGGPPARGVTVTKAHGILATNSIAALIRELQSWSERDFPVRISIDDGETSHPLSRVGLGYGPCLVLSCDGTIEEKQRSRPRRSKEKRDRRQDM